MKKIFLLTLPFAFSSIGHCQQTHIRNVALVDVKTGKIIPGQSVIFNNSGIEYIGTSPGARGANAVIIDGTGKYLMPGMTDAHIHFFQSGSIYTRPDAVDLRKKVPYEKEKQFGYKNAADYMHRYLRLGITTVIDVGGPFANFVIRDSIASSTIAPNVLVTGPLFSMIDNDFFGIDKPIEKISSVKEADALFYRMLAYKPDFIKIWYIAGKKYPAEQNFPIVKHIAELAHKNNLKLAVHATELKTAQYAVEAGADILVHSIEDEIIPADFIKILRDKKITLIPTLIVGDGYYKSFSGRPDNHPQDLEWANPFVYGSITDPEAMGESEMPPVFKMLRKNGIPAFTLKTDSIMSVNLVNLVKGNVNIASGTDAGNIGTMHASSFLQELEAMQKAGMTISQILKASTINAATGFGRDKLWGSIEKGKFADLVLLNKNPLESLQNLNSIHAIFKNGIQLNLDSLIKESPEAIVQKQLNAYNAHNIDAFLNTYSDDIEIYDLYGKIIMKGKEQMKTRYGLTFSTVSNLYCEILKRIIIGNKVIDHEKIRRGNETNYAGVIYEVTNGKISRVTFIR
ncbi:MAG TPA: amidohydrolase family protein [Ferruginibacter sp.]|nr:amidohydrolase family protein [Ferruginibacter sp.]